MLASFKVDCTSLNETKVGKRKRSPEDVDDNQSDAKLKQMKTTTGMPTTLTQKMLDEYVMDYLVESVLPVHHIDSYPFIRLVKRLTSGRLVPRCRQTLVKQL